MSALKSLSRVLGQGGDGSLVFECPGCRIWHQVKTGPGDGPRWGWNGSADRPTFTPSVLVQWNQGEPPATTLEIAEKIRSGEVVQVIVHKVCHSFVTDGRIQFLPDCTHELAGQTVDLPAWDEDWEDMQCN